MEINIQRTVARGRGGKRPRFAMALLWRHGSAATHDEARVYRSAAAKDTDIPARQSRGAGIGRGDGVPHEV